jgi:hypothetical protein
MPVKASSLSSLLHENSRPTANVRRKRFLNVFMMLLFVNYGKLCACRESYLTLRPKIFAVRTKIKN